MKTFKQFSEAVKKPTGDLKKACRTGYTAVGTKEYSKDSCVKEDGMGGGAMSAGPTNVVGGGAIAGSGGKGGEPGVDLRKRKKAHNPVMMGMSHRKPPKI